MAGTTLIPSPLTALALVKRMLLLSKCLERSVHFFVLRLAGIGRRGIGIGLATRVAVLGVPGALDGLEEEMTNYCGAGVGGG